MKSNRANFYNNTVFPFFFSQWFFTPLHSCILACKLLEWSILNTIDRHDVFDEYKDRYHFVLWLRETNKNFYCHTIRHCHFYNVWYLIATMIPMKSLITEVSSPPIVTSGSNKGFGKSSVHSLFLYHNKGSSTGAEMEFLI